MLRLRNRIPVEPAGFKGSAIVRVGDLLACGFVVEPGKASELFSPARCNRRSQVFPKIAEEEKRRFAPTFFTHKEQWRRGSEQHDLQPGGFVRRTHGFRSDRDSAGRKRTQ